MADTISRRCLMGAAFASPLALTGRSADAAAGDARLFFTPSRLALARQLKQSGQLATAWASLHATAKAARTAAPKYFAQDVAKDPTRWWQRYVGWSMGNLAAAYLLGDDPADRDGAIQIAGMAADYPVWGVESQLDGGDLNAADLLFGMAMVVDWLGGAMTSAVRAKLIAALRFRGAQMAAYATGAGTPPAYWSNLWLMNHLWNNMVGLFAAGLALQADAPTDAANFIHVASNRLNTAFAALPPDGSTQESPCYWDFTAECVLKYEHLASEVLGASLSGAWLAKAASYRIATTLPLGSCSPGLSVLNQADAALAPWHGPEYQLRRLAALNRDGASQALAATLEAKGAVKAESPWLNFVWFDPTVPAASATSPAPLQFFDNLELVAARTDWSGAESLLVMRAGPPTGRAALAKNYSHDVGMAHVHQDVNHVTLFAAGQFLLLDDGYSTKKLTAQHNTLLVGGLGQTGEGAEWTTLKSWPIPHPQPSLTVVLASQAVDYWVGVGAPAYPAAAGLLRFNRHVVFVKPTTLVVIDELAAAASSRFSLLWHPGAKLAATGVPLQYHGNFAATSLLASFVLPDGGQVATGSRDFHVKAGPLTVPELTVSLTAQSAQAGAVFSWGGDAQAGQVSLARASSTWTVRTPRRTVSLMPAQRRISVG